MVVRKYVYHTPKIEQFDVYADGLLQGNTGSIVVFSAFTPSQIDDLKDWSDALFFLSRIQIQFE